MTNKKYQLIIFDWDGTLMDSTARIVNCLRAAAKETQVDASQSDDFFRSIIGLGLNEAIDHLYPTITESQRSYMADRYRHHYLIETAGSSQLFEGALKCLDTLKEQGYWLAVATGKGRQGLEQALTETATHNYFLTTRCASETRSKPHPQMLFEILNELGVDAKDALMIGDSEFDLQLASNAKMDSLAVSYGAHSLQRLMQQSPLGYIDNINELPEWLNTQYTKTK